MFGFGKKAKKENAFDIVILKAEGAKNRQIYQIMFPSMVANDIMSMFKKLQKSPFNKPEFLGELGGFRLITHVEGLVNVEVLDDIDLDAHPVQIQDFANILLRRLESVETSEAHADSDDLAFIMGELTMLRDGSFVAQQ